MEELPTGAEPANQAYCSKSSLKEMGNDAGLSDTRKGPKAEDLFFSSSTMVPPEL